MMAKDSGGPYVVFASLCEPDAIGPDGLMTGPANRRTVFTRTDGRVDESVAFVLQLLPGAYGRQPIKLRAEMRRPDRAIFTLFEINGGEVFGEPERLTTLTMPVRLKLTDPGIYLVSIAAFGQIVTRFPIEVRDPTTHTAGRH
jgi:hypothetical protein